MKITDIRTMLLRGPDPHGVGGVERTWHVLLVRIDTDAGVYGLGEAGNMMGDRPAIAYARDWLIGRDPLCIRPFVRAMLSGGLPPWDAKWIGQVVRREGLPLFDETGHVPLGDAPGFGVEIDQAVAQRYLAPGEALF